MTNKVIFSIAFLTGLLIVVAFYVGSTRLAATLGSTLNQLWLTGQGRTSSGAFANYPRAA